MEKETKNKKTKNRRGLFLMALGLTLMAAAGAVTYSHHATEEKAAIKSAEAVAVLEDAISETGGDDRDAVENMLSTFSLNATETIVVADEEYIGILEIPTLGMILPIQSDWSYPQLNVSPCRYMGSAVDNDLIIAGHNYPAHFGYFYRLRGGDSVRFTDVLGNVYDYRVVSVETLTKIDVAEMEYGNWDLTLFTCTTGGADRLVIRCRLQ